MNTGQGSRVRGRSRRALTVGGLAMLAAVILGVLVAPSVMVRVRTASASHPGADSDGLSARGPVYVVHLGEPATLDLAAYRDFYRQRFDLEVIVLPSAPIDPGAFDEQRGQFIAEEVIASMRRSFPEVVDDPNAVLIGVTEQDIYIDRINWAYAFNFRSDGRFGIISSARLIPPGDAAAADNPLQSRVRKMLTKNIGVLVYGLPLNANPTSVLYQNVLSVEDVDAMHESFEGAGPDAAPVAGVDVSYPCFVITPLMNWDGLTPIDTRVDRCLPGLRAERQFDELEVNLESGALVTRHSDFFAPDSMPLALTRAYYSLDTISRAFGIGGNHPYDILPVGGRNPYTYIDIVMPDGATIHYDRISKGFGFANALYEHHSPTAFFGSRFGWNGDGWDLRFTDGSLFVFPENYSGTRSHHGAPFGMQDGAGHRITIQRDGERRLVRLISPTGHSLKFDYDERYRIRQAADDKGKVVSYEYDPSSRLTVISDGDWKTRHAYDNGMLSRIASDNLGTLVEITYRERVVSEIALGNGQRFSFSPVARDGPAGRVNEMEIVDDKGVKRSAPLR